MSAPVARYIGRNAAVLHRFANEDVTFGTWLLGLEIQHVDERRLCCDSEAKCGAQVRGKRAVCGYVCGWVNGHVCGGVVWR